MSDQPKAHRRMTNLDAFLIALGEAAATQCADRSGSPYAPFQAIPPEPAVSPAPITGSAVIIDLATERQRRLRPMRIAG